MALLTLLFTLAAYWISMQLFHRFSFQIYGVDDWNLLGGFVSVLTLSFLDGGLVTSVIDRVNADVIEAREKTKLSFDIYQAINTKLTDPEQEAARRWILTNISIKKEDESLPAWYEMTPSRIMSVDGKTQDGLPEGQRAVKMTLNLLDYIGFIARNYWEIEDDFLDWLGLPPVCKCCHSQRQRVSLVQVQ